MPSHYTPPTDAGTPDVLPTEVDRSAPLADRVAQARAMVERRSAAPEMREPRPDELPDRGVLDISTTHRVDYLAAPHSRDADDSVVTAMRSMDAAEQAIRDAIDTAEAIIGDEATWPGYRRTKYDEQLAETDEAVAEALAEAETAVTVAEAQAISAALPKVDKADVLAADARASRLLGSVRKQTEMPAMVNRLAAREDAVGALVADGEWLGDFLLSAGYEPRMIEALRAQAVASALAAAERSTDGKRAAAARAARAAASGRKGIAALRSGWKITRGSLVTRGLREIPTVTTVTRYV